MEISNSQMQGTLLALHLRSVFECNLQGLFDLCSLLLQLPSTITSLIQLALHGLHLTVPLANPLLQRVNGGVERLDALPLLLPPRLQRIPRVPHESKRPVDCRTAVPGRLSYGRSQLLIGLGHVLTQQLIVGVLQLSVLALQLLHLFLQHTEFVADVVSLLSLGGCQLLSLPKLSHQFCVHWLHWLDRGGHRGRRRGLSRQNRCCRFSLCSLQLLLQLTQFGFSSGSLASCLISVSLDVLKLLGSLLSFKHSLVQFTCQPFLVVAQLLHYLGVVHLRPRHPLGRPPRQALGHTPVHRAGAPASPSCSPRPDLIIAIPCSIILLWLAVVCIRRRSGSVALRLSLRSFLIAMDLILARAAGGKKTA
mmetsp:Transcript_34974/g.80037  ORF Transcript_34974/g.80037 Transcript_34974/m.80037 type:complete len:364 (-) Transcript_34974:334-1425(-)